LPSAKDSEKHYVAFVPESPDTKQKTDLGRALVNITKLCFTSPKLSGNDEDWLKILEKAEKNKVSCLLAPLSSESPHCEIWQPEQYHP
jgi:hypothetical protein